MRDNSSIHDGGKGRIPIVARDAQVVEAQEHSTRKINALLRGPATRLFSSKGLPLDAVHIEHHIASPYEKNESTSDNHVIALFRNHVARGESAVVPGQFVHFSFLPGSMNLYSPGPMAACRSFADFTMTVCALDPKFVYEVGKEGETPSLTEFRRKTNVRDGPLESLVMVLAEEIQSGCTSGQLYLDYLTHALALRLLRLVRGPEQTNSLRHRACPRVLRRVLEKMEAEVANDLDLNTLASESGYSRTHFLRIFKADQGCAPHQWLMRLRVERAKRLLRQSSRPLIDIAAECGFSSHSHFAMSFRRITGITPSQYRRTPELSI